MHEAARAQRNPLRGNVETVGRGISRSTRDRVGHGSLTEASELSLRERAKDHAVLRVAGGDGSSRIADRARAAATAATPDHPGEAEMFESERSREARGVVAIVGIAGDAVDVADVDAGVLGGLDDRFAGEAKFGDRRLPAFVVLGFADPDDRDPVLNCVFAHRHLAVAVFVVGGRIAPSGLTADARRVSGRPAELLKGSRIVYLAAAAPCATPLTGLDLKCGITSSAIKRIDLNHGSGLSA